MAAEATLGELVDPLLGTGSSGLDHIKDPALVGRKTDDLTGDLPAELDALAEASLAGGGAGGLGDLGDLVASILSFSNVF